MDTGLDGVMPPIVPWFSVAEYLALYDRRVVENIAYVVRDSPLRVPAIGWNDRPPTCDEARKTRELLRQGIEEGAVG